MFVRSLQGNPGVFQQDRIGSNNTHPDQDVTPQVVGRGDSNQEKKKKAKVVAARREFNSGGGCEIVLDLKDLNKPARTNNQQLVRAMLPD